MTEPTTEPEWRTRSGADRSKVVACGGTTQFSREPLTKKCKADETIVSFALGHKMVYRALRIGTPSARTYAKEQHLISYTSLKGTLHAPRRLGLALAALALCTAVVWPTYLATSSTYCRIRVLIAAPDVATVDVLTNSVQIAAGNKLGDFTPYVSRPTGYFGLRVFPPGVNEAGKAYASHNVSFKAGQDYTIVVFGKLADKTLDIVAETDTNTLDAANTRVRFGNYASGGATALALTTSDGSKTTSAGSAPFGKTTGTYAVVPPTPAATVTQATAHLSANTVVSAFAIPGSGGNGTTLLLQLDAGTTATPLNPVPATAIGGSSASPAAVPTSVSPISTPTLVAAIAPTTAPTTGTGASMALRAALAPVPMVANTNTKVFYAPTAHTLGGSFKTYWESHGGLEQFGYPITEEYQEVSATDGKTYTTQYFERARFEYHPENAGTPSAVQQGLLGREMLKLLAGA